MGSLFLWLFVPLMMEVATYFDALTVFGMFCATNGVAIMLTLFAVCRTVPLLRTWRTANAAGRSIPFNAAWIIGYAIGLSQFAVGTGEGWIGHYTAQIYLINAALVFVDLCLIAVIARGERALRSLT